MLRQSIKSKLKIILILIVIVLNVRIFFQEFFTLESSEIFSKLSPAKIKPNEEVSRHENDVPTRIWKVEEENQGDILVPLAQETLELLRRLNLSAPGYMGAPVKLPETLPEDLQTMRNASWQEFKFNEFVSRLVPMDRELPDFRQHQGTCANASYAVDLPKVSVILSFYNEPFSMMMRTLISVLKRSPPDLIEEIILVDDASDDEKLLKPLNEFIPKFPKVKLIVSPIRLGLMRARILGAKSATAPILVIMDSNVEVTHGWLPPLLDPIVRNPFTITLPAVETLDMETLEYQNVVYDLYDWVGGFTWELMYTWTQIPTPNKSETPLPSPTMLGAAFVIRRDYFEYLGFYDSGFELWGGENLELSFKVWMCGGKMYQAMCSHVGHMFRNRPYWNAEADIKMRRNTDRLAEVWLDEYKKFYHRATNFNNREIGDVSEQKKLREQLGCKSFNWFMTNVCPGCFVPPE